MLLKDSLAAKKAEKAAAAAPVEVTTDAPKDPAWDAVRETTRQMAGHGRMFLRCQVRIGMLLSNLKKAHGYHPGQPKKNSPDSGEYLPWPDLVKRESGYSRQSADVFIQLYEATIKKLKTGKKLDLPAEAKKQALAIFRTESALTLTEEQWQTVDSVISSATDGETQKSLLQHLKLVPEPQAMPKGGKTPGAEPEQVTAGQLAFHFFGAVAAPLINARSNPDYKKLLMALPTDSTEEAPISLSTLEAEFRSVLADIEEIKTANLRAARGRTVD
ncbi:hypothetical protein OVA24_06380 [Luteolibacter sp. SL250]|uniref:hypothetical protein n=1 Tax=Luteolibacter sp. SL250 TaxID=2995170 RepID=UPI002270D043|nr:hypothetical protein [Luteolibacter sp. SL250]WAC21008.1 hypothetical protein OVA24_06380 [Luteolibacter sp. SL250]